jgi:hypothetical protein
MITRKRFLKEVMAGYVAGTLPFRSVGKDTAAIRDSLMIPYPAKPWSQATRLVGHRPPPSLSELRSQSRGDYSGSPWYNDFCLIQDLGARWHCIGILIEGTSAKDFRNDRLFHYVSDSVEGPYESAGYIDLGYGQGANVWAPYIVWDGRRALMFYHYHRDPSASDSSIRVAQSEDPQLGSWRRVDAHEEVLFSEAKARDPHVIRKERDGGYLMYYVCSLGGGSDAQNVVRVRISHDLFSWSEPRTVLGTPPGYLGSESVFVLPTDNHYCMWISGADYSRLSLYISYDPFNFGDATANRIEEQPGHASEIVRANGRYWMACVRIASVSGLHAGQADLEGVYIQPLEWRAATPEQRRRVVGPARSS